MSLWSFLLVSRFGLYCLRLDTWDMGAKGQGTILQIQTRFSSNPNQSSAACVSPLSPIENTTWPWLSTQFMVSKHFPTTPYSTCPGSYYVMYNNPLQEKGSSDNKNPECTGLEVWTGKSILQCWCYILLFRISILWKKHIYLMCCQQNAHCMRLAAVACPPLPTSFHSVWNWNRSTTFRTEYVIPQFIGKTNFCTCEALLLGVGDAW